MTNDAFIAFWSGMAAGIVVGVVLAAVFAAIANHKKYGNTVIMVTHNEAIQNMADHTIKLRDGKVRKNIINEHKISAEELDW